MTASADVQARWRPEYRLLLRMAQGPDRDRAEEFEDGLDWPLLVRTALAHAVGPLVEWHVRGTKNVPAAVREELSERFRDNALYSLVLAGELVRLARFFAEDGIRILPFKGPTLAARAYGNLALRDFVDLDLLLAPSDVARARKLLASAGYHCKLPLPPAQEEAYLASIGQMPFVRESPRILVELHARLMPRDFHFPLTLEHLLPRRQPVVLAGQEVFTLGDEDLLVVLCAHGGKHGWASLGWIADVAALVRACPALDWEKVLTTARALRSERILSLGILLAHDLLAAPPPPEFLRRARASSAVRGLAGRVYQQLFREADGRPQGFQQARFQLGLRERPGDGLRYAASLALTPTVADWTAMQLPSALSFLYQLFRPFRLAAKYGPHAAKRNPPAPPSSNR
jgi:hypothetical protein